MAAKKKSATSKKVAAKKGGTAKKAAAKAPAQKKAAPVKAPSNAAFDKVDRTRTKSQILAAIADRVGVSKKDVNGVFEALSDLIGHDLKKGPGSFTVPGLMKVVVVRKPATKARKGVNPFTGEEMMFKAKPARNTVRVRPLKGLKEKV